MREQLLGKLVNQGSKIPVVIDKAATISHGSGLTIYLKYNIQDFEDS